MKYKIKFCEIGNIIKFALSIIFGNIVMVCTSLLNMRLLGSFDHHILYILTMFSPVYYFLLAFQESFRSASIVIASHCENTKKIRVIIREIIFIALLCNVFVAILFFISTDWITHIMHVNEVLQNRFQSFTKKMVCINFILMVNIVLNALILGFKFHRVSFFFNLLTCLLTTVLLLLQITYLHQGLDGFVIASCVINIVCGILMLTFINHCIADTNYSISSGQQTAVVGVINAIIYKIIFKVGSPVFLSYVTMFVGFAVFNSVLTKYGVDIVSGYGIACRLQLLIILPAIGLGSAMAILINHQMALKKYNEVLSIVFHGMIVCIIIYGIFALLIHYYDNRIVALLVSERTVKESAINYLHHVSYSYFISGPVITFISMLEQIGYGIYALLLNGFYFICVGIITKIFMQPQTNYIIFYKIISLVNFLSLFVSLLLIPILIKRFKHHDQLI